MNRPARAPLQDWLLEQALRWQSLWIVLATLLLASAAQAQAPRPDEAAVIQEVMDVRDRLRQAVAAKDRAALEALYADNFQHLRDTGRADLKGDRITLLLAGEPLIETAPEQDLVVQVYGPGAAAATGTSPIPDPASKRPARFRWLVLYVKREGGWRVALSQATRMRTGR